MVIRQIMMEGLLNGRDMNRSTLQLIIRLEVIRRYTAMAMHHPPSVSSGLLEKITTTV